MPLRIQTLDALAREKGRDVLFLAFQDPFAFDNSEDDLDWDDDSDDGLEEDLDDDFDDDDEIEDEPLELEDLNTDDLPEETAPEQDEDDLTLPKANTPMTQREYLVAWLKAAGIAHWPCYPARGTSAKYQGELYLDVPHSLRSAQFKKLVGELEDDEGNAVFPGVWLCVHPLGKAPWQHQP